MVQCIVGVFGSCGMACILFLGNCFVSFRSVPFRSDKVADNSFDHLFVCPHRLVVESRTLVDQERQLRARAHNQVVQHSHDGPIVLILFGWFTVFIFCENFSGYQRSLTVCEKPIFVKPSDRCSNQVLPASLNP